MLFVKATASRHSLMEVLVQLEDVFIGKNACSELKNDLDVSSSINNVVHAACYQFKDRGHGQVK